MQRVVDVGIQSDLMDTVISPRDAIAGQDVVPLVDDQ